MKKFNKMKGKGILTEMARTVSFFGRYDDKLNAAYDYLRKYISTKVQETSGVISEKAMQYMRDFILDNVELSPEESKLLKSAAGGVQMASTKKLILKLIASNRIQERPFILHMVNDDKIDQFLNIRKTIQGSRSMGKEQEVQKITDLSREELAELNRVMAPMAKRIGDLMRKKNKGGLESESDTEGDEFDNNTIYTEHIIDALYKYMHWYRSTGQESKEERSLFAARDEQKIPKVPEKEVEKVAKHFENMISNNSSVDSDGFENLINKLRLKALPREYTNFLEYIKKTADGTYFDYITNTSDDNAQIPGLPEYDGEIVRMVVPELQLKDFMIWAKSKKALEEYRKQKEDDRFLELVASGKKVVGESFDIADSILEEQIKSSKFSTQKPIKENRNFRKAPNTYYWLEENKRLFGE